MSPIASSSGSSFLRNLAATFHVESTALAVFILILICLVGASLIGLLFFFIYYHMKQKRHMQTLRGSVRNRKKTLYLNEPEDTQNHKGKYGKLTYGIRYDRSDEKLTVYVVQARQVKVVSEECLPDMYVTVKLASNKYGKLEQIGDLCKTKLQRQTVAPNWNFQCTFDVKEEDLKYTVLILELFSYDSIRQDRSIGRLTIHLDQLHVNAYTDTTLEKSSWLQAGEPEFSGLGEMCIGLSYQQTLERLECHVYEARYLQVNDYVDSTKHQKISVRVELRCNQNCVGSFETLAKSDLISPYFNETFVFKLNAKHLSDSKIICELQSRGKRGQKLVLGSFTIGPSTEMSAAAKHWEEMIQDSPRSHVMWHTWVPKDF